jgi:flagellin
MTVINTNTGSLYAQQAMNTNSRGLATVMQQLSTGKRINNAVDDVAGLAISTRLTSQIKGLNQAVRNANDAISLIQTAEGATEQVTNMLQRMRELSIQASNDTNNDKDRVFLDLEFQQLKDEIDRVGMNTQWNGKNILDGTAGKLNDGNFTFQIGANANQIIGVKLPNLQSAPFSRNFGAPTANPAVDTAFSSFAQDKLQQPNKGVQTFAVLDPTTPGVKYADGKAYSGSVEFNFSDLNQLYKADGTAWSKLDPYVPPDPGPQVSLGVVIQATIAGKAVQYKISQADIDNAKNYNQYGDGPGSPPGAKQLSVTVADALKQKLSDQYVGLPFLATAPGGVLTVTATGLESFGEFNTVTSPGGAMVQTVTGDLNSIDPSANILNGTHAAEGLARIDAALQTINQARSAMGAVVSRLQFAADNLFNVSAKATESRSRIEDTDYSMATTELAKRNIIQQAAQAMLAQANQAPQMVLQLLK